MRVYRKTAKLAIMKAYSIGRDQSCDIVINDSTDVVSRRHAVLNVLSWGKFTIIDQSSNGTYVNGIRITSNVPVPVTRKDIISFAHVAKLDWNSVPSSNAWMRYLIIGFIGIFLVLSGFFAYHYVSGHNGASQNVELRDSVRTDKGNSKAKKNTDSISASKGKSDAVKKKITPPKVKSKPEKSGKTKEDKKGEKGNNKEVPNRPIG